MRGIVWFLCVSLTSLAAFADDAFTPGVWNARAEADRVWLEHANHPERPALYGWNHLSPRLTTPQWVGDDETQAVIILAIDDMRESARYEAFLRPILQRLKQIDGRAPVSIMTCDMQPEDPQLQAWLDEGLSLECHTIDHPCPLLGGNDFAKAAATYWNCVDRMALIPRSHPVAFRMPCCDSLNTMSPRAVAEIIDQPSPGGYRLQIDSSVFNVFNDKDPSIPTELVIDAQGRPRFEKYLPIDRTFVNTIENYPYPYLVGEACWEFPCLAPSDWSAQHFHGNANPDTLADWQAAVDITVIKQGVMCVVFHPYEWSTPEMFVDLIDYVEEHHPGKVKFLTFREALFALQENVLGVEPSAEDAPTDVRLVDANLDGHFDVVFDVDQASPVSRIWNLPESEWVDIPLPPPFLLYVDAADFLILPFDSALEPSRKFTILSSSHGAFFQLDRSGWNILPPAFRAEAPDDSTEWSLDFIDVDGDGASEMVASTLPSADSEPQFQLARLPREGTSWPYEPINVSESITTQNLVDIDEDGCLDLIIPGEDSTTVRLFQDFETLWPNDDAKIVIPPIVNADGANSGFFVHSRHLIWQNENTADLPDLIERRSFDEILAGVQPGPMDPARSQSLIDVRPGLVVEFVACEPLVMDPVAFDWGADGKLWVVEMADYPRGVDDAGAPGGRVRFLTDTDGDGEYDTSTLFLDGLPIPTGVMAWGNGVLITAAPNILYAEDTTGDGVADVVTPLYTGFNEGNPQHRVGGLVWGIDNWIYCANGDSDGEVTSMAHRDAVSIQGRDFRIRPATGAIETQTGRTQFGRACSDYGDWFGCNNSNPCFHFVLDEHYLARNPALAPPTPQLQVPEIPGAAPCYPISRLLERFNDYHMENLFTSACGITFYRDNHLGAEFEGNLFVCEPVHNLVSRQIVSPDGVSFRGVRAPDERDREFLVSRDNWFRPTMARTGPDGALWISDMYRHVIEHPQWIPEEWQERLNLRAGEDRGRIYRVYHRDRPPRPILTLTHLTTTDLVAAMDSPNHWQRDMAQRLLLERNDPAAVEPLKALATSCDRPQTRAHALWTLNGLGAMTPELALAAMNDPHPGVRRQGAKLSEQFLAAGDVDTTATAARLMELATDADPQVQMQVAYSLGETNDDRFAVALAELLHDNRDNEYLVAAAMSSLHEQNIEAVLLALLEREAAVAVADDALSGRLLGMASRLGKRGIVRQMLQSYIELDPADPAAGLRRLAGVLQLSDADAILRRDDSDDLRSQLDVALATAHEIAVDADADADEATRLAAVQLMRYSRDMSVIPSLAELLTARESPAVQQAVLSSLSRLPGDDAITALLDVQRQVSPELQSQLLDFALEHPEGARLILERLEAGTLAVAELTPVHRQRLQLHPDEQLRTRAEELLAGSASSRQELIDYFRAALDLSANATHGQELFRKTCSNCHRVGEHGYEVGPDLAALRDRSGLAMLIALLDPNHSVEQKYLVFSAADIDGRIHTGYIESETANSVTLLAAEGKRVTLLRQDLELLVNTGKSAMPEGLEKDLTVQDMADLLSYVSQIGGERQPRKEFPGNSPSTIAADANGDIVLTPASAEIYGPTIILEERYGNLGYWSSLEDHAIWTIEVPEAGQYSVEIEYACPDDNAVNRLRLSCGDEHLVYEVSGTGTWDDYQRMTIGRWRLPAGTLQLVAEGVEPIHGAVLDLREIRFSKE